ncbi:mitochondrial-like ubiquitin ligase activator of NFKB 1-like, partial [Trifolium medium]|nr:mitochondrial-like ubiquitin ligase activator of NFKB 1-like [Trifolium medium]
DDGTDHVHVAGARGATGFVYPIVSSKFDESGQTLVCGTLDSLRDKKILGLKRIERVLPVGTSLTVVGQIANGARYYRLLAGT